MLINPEKHSRGIANYDKLRNFFVARFGILIASLKQMEYGFCSFSGVFPGLPGAGNTVDAG